MISRFIGFMICLVGVLLPFRLRILFSEFLGWLYQGGNFFYYGTLNFLLRSLRTDKKGVQAYDEQ